MATKIRLGISSCLLGEKVRWDGGHKLDHFLKDTLGEYVEYVPVCPEVEVGFGVPRETLRLTGNPDAPRLMTTRSGIDQTARMRAWARKRVQELEGEGLCGYIFKSGSPSSGMTRVKVYNARGMAEKKGVGIFARVFMDHFPLLPVEEEGRLHDPKLRENFIEQIFTLKRWRETLAQGKTLRCLVDFHTDHKLLLLAHSPAHYRQMGRWVAEGQKLPAAELFAGYERLLIEALRLNATVKKNVNVLHHMMGYFKKQLSADEKQELLAIIQRYQEELVPLIVPIVLINHYVRKYQENYLSRQVYLNPHPVALKLRNHV